LPAAAGTDPLRPPLVVCYLSSDPLAGAWFVVADADGNTTQPRCYVRMSNARWTPTLGPMPSNYTAAISVVY
jgi:hypothetical protein